LGMAVGRAHRAGNPQTLQRFRARAPRLEGGIGIPRREGGRKPGVWGRAAPANGARTVGRRRKMEALKK
jgi:hypothetical protein